MVIELKLGDQEDDILEEDVEDGELDKVEIADEVEELEGLRVTAG